VRLDSSNGVDAVTVNNLSRRRVGSFGVLFVPAIAGAILALAPLLYLAVRSTEQGWGAVWEELSRPQTRQLMQRSALLTVSTTVLCTFIGVAGALFVGLTNVWGRRVWEVLLALPLAIPTYVAGYTWLGTFDDPNPFIGSVGVLTMCSYPYVYIPVLAALKRLDPTQAEAARSLGSSRIDVLKRVTLPQIRPAITSGALLVALYALSDFGAISLMRYDTLTQGIYLSYVSAFDRTPAAILGCLLVAVTSLIVLVERRQRGAMNSAVVSARSAPRPTRLLQLRWSQPFAILGIVGVLALGLGVPVVALARWFARSGDVDFGQLAETFGSTVLTALLGAGACALLAVPIALLSVRRRSRVSSFLESSTYLGHALPGLVIALSMVFIGIRFLTPIYQRLPLLVMAYVVLFLPLAVASSRTSLNQAPPVLEEVGRSLGESRMGSLRRITMRIASPGIIGGTALVALTCIKELPATLLLRPTGFETLATRVWTDTSVADYGQAAPSAIAMVLLGVIPMLLLNRTSRP
jgi:iron(III) transport system permease protein